MSKSNNKAYLRFIVFVIFTIIAFLLPITLPFTIALTEQYFQLSHAIFETLSLIFIAMILVIAALPLQKSRNHHTLIIGSTFLGASILEFAHFLTFDGTFAMSILDSRALSAKFSAAAQGGIAAGLLLRAFSRPSIVSAAKTFTVLAGTILLTAISIVIISQMHLSGTSAQEGSSQPNSVEFVIGVIISIAFATTAFTEWLQIAKNRAQADISLASASALFAMAGILFTGYMHTDSFASVLGHLFKVLAYCLVLYSLVQSNIKAPFNEINHLRFRYQSILNALPDLVFEVSKDGRILHYHSDDSHDSLVTDPATFEGKYFAEFLSPEATKACEAAIEESSNTGSSYGLQYSLALSTGMHRFEVSVAKVKPLFESESFLCIVRDISERYFIKKRLEALLEFTEKSNDLDERDIVKLGLSALEKLTYSTQSFIHIIEKDIEDKQIVAWHSESQDFFNFELHLTAPCAPLSKICNELGADILSNHITDARLANASPSELPNVERLICVPIYDGELICMVVAVANSNAPYRKNTVKTVEFFASQLHQVIKRQRAHRNSERDKKLLNSALDNLPVGVSISTMGTYQKILYLNPYFYQAYDIEPGAVTGVAQFWELAYDDETVRTTHREEMHEDIKSGDPDRLVRKRIPVYRNKQLIRYLNVHNILVPNSPLLVTLIENVTEAVLQEEELRIAAVAFSSQEGVIITDAKHRILRVNPSFEEATGYTANELIGKTPKVFRADSYDKARYQGLIADIKEKGIWRGEVWNRHRKGHRIPFSLTISAVRGSDGEITHYVGTYIDLSEIKLAQEKISKLAYYDTLTGLPNREYLKKILTEKLRTLDASTDICAALMIDLDNFKMINDTLGHDAGDNLLLQVTHRMQHLLRPGDQLARYGGDEFIVILQSLGADTEQASLKTQQLANLIISSLEDTYKIGDSLYFSTTSIGVTLLKNNAPTAKEVLRELDIALSNAKSDGNNNIRFFDPVWQTSVIQRAQLLDELRNALKEHQFELFYQAQVDSADSILGAEALIRWNHPTRGLLGPFEFLPAAQENRLMKKIGDEVMRLGLQQLQQWQHSEQTSHLTLSLNITADQFYDESFEPSLLDAIDQKKISPKSLKLEFTESMLLGDIACANQKIERLKEHGIQFSIDDFGTGYSSLSYLSTLTVEQLKIDQSFVQNIGVVESDEMIVKTIIDMAKTLRLQVIAEGVETLQQKSFLLNQGCEMFQGYLFSKPISIADFNALVLTKPH